MTKALQTNECWRVPSAPRRSMLRKRLQQLSRQYVAGLKRYWASQDEAGLEEAYRLGREAVASGVGVLDMARLCRRTLALATGAGRQRKLQAAETFFLEALSPFEVMHRGFRETNTRLAQLIATLEKRNGDLAALSNQIVQLQEEDRKRLSRELHDNIGQTLTAVSFALAALQGTAGAESFRETLGHAQHLVNESNDAIQNFARELRPSLLDQLGLLPALRSMASGFVERTGVTVRITGSDSAEQLTNTQKTVLFRIAQERLGRVTNLSPVATVEIAICKVRRGVCMTIADDATVPSRNGNASDHAAERITFLGMQERVRLIHGKFKAVLRPQRGTTLRVTIPYLDKESDSSARANAVG